MNLYDYIVGESPKAKTSSNATDFANQYGSIADQVGQKLGVSPDLILSQLALETGYGKSVIPGTNNLGNIKDFSGGGVAATDNMTGSRDKYRQYDTPEDFANDYADLLSRKYKGIVGAGDNADKFIAGLRGYAEDPNYGNKIKSVLANIKGTPRTTSETPQAAPAAQTRPGYMSDDPFDPFSTNPIQYGAKPESQGFATRAAESFGKGSGQLIKGLGWLVQSDTVQGLGDRATQYWSQKLEQDPETMKQLKAVTDAKGFWDSAKEVVTNPRALSDFIFSSLPAQAVGMGAGALTSRAVNSLAYNMAIKAGATEGIAFEAAQMAAAKAAQSAAVKAGSATNMAAEGVTQGAMSGAETEEYLVSQGMSREEAHAEALKTAAKVGISTAALSGLTAGMETRAAMGVGNKSGIKAVAGSTGKGALEEGAQNVSQEYFETGAKQQVTPGYEADYGKAFTTGALTGGVMSGGTHALGNIAASPEPVIPTVEALNQQSSEIAKAKIDDIGKATTVDQAVQSFTEAATQPLQVDTAPLDTARQVVQQMEAERVAAPVGEQVGDFSTTTPLADDSLNSRSPISQKISQPELPQATPQEKESQVKSAIATPAMREMMGRLPAEQRAEVLNLSNQSVSGSLESRAPAIERLHQIMSDNGALTTTGEPIAQPKQNIQQLKEQVKSIVSTPEWTAHLQTLSPSERTFANEVVNSVNNPKLPAGYRSMLAEVVNDYNAQLPTKAKANEPAAMIADNNFEPEIGKLAYVAPDTLPKVGDGLTQDKAMSIQKLGKVFGKEVHFYNQEGSQTRLDGYADPKYKDAIFVNANKGDAAWHYVAGHEFFHQLDPKIKKSFIEAVAPLVPADRLGKLKEYINQGKLDEAGQWEEIGADLFGNRFGEEGFLGKALAGVKDTSTLMKMVSAIRDFVTKVLASAKEQGFATDRFVSDLDKVRAAAEEALKQHLNQEKTKDVSEPAKAKEETTQAKTAEDTQSAIKILEQAGITGKERLDAIKDVKAGTVSIQELESAYPAKIESKEDIAERNRIAAEKDKAFTDYATPKEDELDSIVEAGRDAKVREAEGLTQLQGFDEDVKTAIEEKMQDAVNNILSIPVSKRSSLQKKLLKKFSIQENQKPAPKPAKKGSGVQSLRDSLKRKNPFLAFLAENGINTADRSDVGGQDSKRYFASGYGAIFRKKGLRLDELAQLAEERGFLTQADVANESDNGGVNKLADMINQAINGEVVTTGEQDFDFQSYYDDQLKNTALEFGIDIRGKSLDRLADLVNMHYASMDESTIAAREAEFESQLQEINNDALAKLQQYSIENLLENDEQFTQRSTQNNDEPSSEVTPKNYQQRNFKKENFNQREVERILDIPEENRSNKQTEFLNRNAKLSSERNTQSLDDFKQEIKDKYPDANLRLMKTKAGDIELSKIEVGKDSRNEGIATSVMNDVVGYADSTNSRIVLSPTSDFGANKNRLTEFYKRFDFVENKGSNRDDSISESMYREPQQVKLSTARNSIPLYQENKSIPDTLKEVAKDPQLAVDAAKGLLTSGKPQSELVETIVTNLFDSTNTMEQIARRTGKNEEADKFLTTQKLYKAASQKVVNDAVKEYADPMMEKLQAEWKDKYSKMAWYKETGYKQFLNDIGTIGNLVKHGPERNTDIARKTEGKDQAGSGRTNEEIAQIEKDIRREAPGLIELYEDIYANNLKPMIDIGNNAKRESGLITPEMEAARQNYEWYVPLYGDPSEFDNTNVGSGGGGLKSIKDKNAMGRSGTLADNVMQNVLKQMSSAVQQAGSQELKSALVDWVKSSPAAKLAMGAKINDAGTREIFEKYTGPDGLVHERVKPGAAISPTAMVYKNGNETTVIDFKNAKVIESLNGNKPIEGILSGVQKATRLMGAVFTRYNPIFPVMNKLRDSQSQISFVMADAPVENKFKAAQDTLANNLKFSTQWGKNESPEYAEWKEKFEKLGGATMYADILHDDVMKNIEREFAVQVDNKLIANKLANRLGKVIDGVNEHMEMSSRIAMFKALVDNGMTERAAALYTKNTMNFETKGKWGQQLGAIYTFAGPALFDARRMAQSLRTPRGALVMAAQFGMMFAMYGALKALGGDDEDGVARLNKVPVNQSGRFLTFITEDGTGYKIPVGFGYSRIALTLAASLHRYIDGVDDIGHFAQNVAIDGLISNFSVIEPKDISIKKDFMGWAMQTFLPTITQPMYQVAANQNFQGGPIHKPDEWTGSKLRFDQSWPNTPELFKDAAKNLYDTTGIDVYPETLSHLTRSYGGNGVMDVVRAFQLVGEKAEKDWSLVDIPAAQGFAARAPAYDSNVFRRKFEEAQKLESERKYAMKEGSLADFDAEHPDMLRDLSIYKSANKVIKELYTQRKAVAGTDDAKAINERIRSIQMRANKEAAAN